jgi:hypothetical protein
MPESLTQEATVPATLPTRELSPQSNKLKSMEERHAAMIRRVDERIRDRASRVLANAYLADSINDGDPMPEGWTPRMYRTALDARKCGKEAPVYLSMAAKTLDSFKRTEAVRPTAPPQLHADVKVYVRGDLNIGANYKVVDVVED